MSNRVLIIVLTVVCGLTSLAIGQSRGVLGREAPSWRVDEWFQLPEGMETLDVVDYRGKVIYFYGFQSWCPGCHSHGFPTLGELIRRFEGTKDVAFVAVQTTFEGFNTNTAPKALVTAKRYGLKIPIGHSGSDNRRSRIMIDYRTGGTPWTIIIDRKGVVRFNNFRISADAGEHMIKQLLKEPAPTATQIVTLPTACGGQDRIGKRFPKIPFSRWIKADAAVNDGSETPGLPDDAAPKKQIENIPSPRITLYRWWIDGCPYCNASMPAMETLRKKYTDDGLRVVGVYHPKPPRAVDDQVIRAAAADYGFHGDIAVDEDWSVLRAAYLRWGKRKATSVSILVDKQGIIRFVHPGPAVFPSSKAANAQENQDYTLLENAIRQLLKLEDRESKQ
ncbi:MAG: TlpA family protein disulfide reductase [Planctomycetes bacterium]|nr:TlpA family protein disulfide reductase [Planctomycetota bacterium]